MILWLALLVLGALAMWTAVPVGWLWIGAQFDSPPIALAGAVASMIAVAWVLGGVNRRYQAARVRRGLDDTGSFPLEVTLVCSAFAAAAGFVAFYLAWEGALGPDR